MNNYDDIINLEHYEFKNHKRMSKEMRAAQFAPFAALTGYNDEVREKARLTDKKIILDEELIDNINTQLDKINEMITSRPLVTITYFVPDKLKEGGKYQTYTDHVKRIDKVMKCVKLVNKNIDMNDILLIEIDESNIS